MVSVGNFGTSHVKEWIVLSNAAFELRNFKIAQLRQLVCVESLIPRPNFTQMRVSIMAIHIASQQNAPSFLTGSLQDARKSMLYTNLNHQYSDLNSLIYKNEIFRHLIKWRGGSVHLLVQERTFRKLKTVVTGLEHPSGSAEHKVS